MTDARRSAPHVARNTGPILELLRETLPQRGLVLEVASGSGEQSLAFARAFPKLLWQPSDPDPAGLASIEAWRDNEAVFNLLPPVELDARTAGWPIASAEAIVCINMVHISPSMAPTGGRASRPCRATRRSTSPSRAEIPDGGYGPSKVWLRRRSATA